MILTHGVERYIIRQPGHLQCFLWVAAPATVAIATVATFFL
jgi:hypothetical protein